MREHTFGVTLGHRNLNVKARLGHDRDGDECHVTQAIENGVDVIDTLSESELNEIEEQCISIWEDDSIDACDDDA